MGNEQPGESKAPAPKPSQDTKVSEPDNALSENAQAALAALKASRAIQDDARDLGLVPTIPQMTDQKFQELAEEQDLQEEPRPMTEAEIRTAQALWRYTDAWKAIEEFKYQHAQLLIEYEQLQNALDAADEELRRAARASGDTGNEWIRVSVNYPVSREYDGFVLLARAPWLEQAGVCKRDIIVDAKKVETLVKKQMLAAEVLDGAVTEKPRTPAVSLDVLRPWAEVKRGS